MKNKSGPIQTSSWFFKYIFVSITFLLYKLTMGIVAAF